MNNLRYKYYAFLLFIALSFVFTGTVHAEVYPPGSTLNPSCLPTDSNCSVTPPVTVSNSTAGGGLQFENGNLELTDGGITFAKWSSNSCNNGQVPKFNGTAWVCGNLDKTVIGLSNVENTALSTWAGSTSLTTLGTIVGLNVNGKVGIGTTSPGYILETNETVTGVSGIRLQNLSSSSSARTRMILADESGDKMVLNWNNADNSGGVGTLTNRPFNFYQNDTTRMTIAAGGNIGIGTTSPTATLSLVSGGVINSLGALTVNSTGANTLSFDSGTTGNINIGTGANSKTITIGNTTEATRLAFNAGSGNIQFQSGAVTINTTTNRMGFGMSDPGAFLSLGAQESRSGSLYVYEDPHARLVRGFGVGLAQVGRNELSIFTSDGEERDGAITLGVMNPEYSYAPKVTIKTRDGFVGISTTDPRHLLDMGESGGFYDETIGKWVEGSDRAYKNNVLDLTKYGLDTIAKLRPVSYEFKRSGVAQIGFVAQEVQGIVPEVVSGEDGHMGISYGEFVPILVKAIQEQQVDISGLKENTLAANDAITFSKTISFDKAPVMKKGVEIIDQANGDVYCTYIVSGEWKKEKNNCDNIVVTTQTPTPTPTSVSTSEPTMSPSTIPTPTIEISPTSTPSATPTN